MIPVGIAFKNSYQSNETQNKLFWDVIPNRAVSYLYAPGLLGSEMIMCRFCPEFTALSGEKITCTKGGHVIGQPHSAVVFDDVNINKPTVSSWCPFTSVVNGFRVNLFPLVENFLHNKYGITVVDNPNSKLTVVNYLPRLASSDIGQQKDIKSLRKAYLRHVKKYPDLDLILYGDSRGAATIFNFITLHKPVRVKAAVLEGIFDTVPHCIKHFLYDNKQSHTENSLHQMLAWATWRYRANGINPLKCADTIDDHIPLLLVTSLKDGLVPAQGTINIYKKLKARGHHNVHLLVLQNSLHPIYMMDDAQDQKAYETVVHAFYKQYNLPHNYDKAAQGRKLFLATQPALADLDKLYPVVKCELCN